MHNKPYLSIVAAARNDDHGGNILKRMTLFVQGLIEQCNKHQLPAELIIVEWNPVLNRPLLQHVLPQPVDNDNLVIRYIEIPALIHNRYKRSKEIPLFQMIAKNAGIRRATADFILCTNIDLLFSDALFQLLAARNLRGDTYYRANRCDVSDNIDPQWSLEKQLHWCGKNIIRTLGRDMRFKHINLEQAGLNDKAWYKKWIFDKMAIFMKLLWPSEKRKYYMIDSFACGDFTLMSRKAWLDIGGYIELDLYSIHIDTMAIIAASALGYRQHVFNRKACTYHIDHTSGWSSMTPLEKIKFTEERPGLDYGLIFESGLYALKKKSHLDLNAPDWGFAGEELEEFIFPQTYQLQYKLYGIKSALH
jgi:hypothetical protein